MSFKGISVSKLDEFVSGVFLHVGIPSALVKGIVPFGTYVITALLAVYGSSIVAGYGAGVKTEFVVLCVVNAISAVMVSYIGQNYGAKQIGRMTKGFRFACFLNLIYGAAMYILLFFAAPYIAMLFSREPDIMLTTVHYIRIGVLSVAFQGIVMSATSSFNAVGKPIHAASISLLQMFVLYIPLSYLLSSWMGATGIFLALVVSNAAAAGAGYLLFFRFLQKQKLLWD